MKTAHAVLLAACVVSALSAAPVAESVDVTTIFDLYGPQVEPFSGDKESAVKKAIAQSAGHGVTEDKVDITVVKTYADQEKGRRLSRKLLQDGQLVQPGVELKSVVQTDDGSAQPVAEAITNALAQPYQLVSVYKSNGQEADYSFFVSTATGDGGSPPSGDNPSPPADSGNTPAPTDSNGNTDSNNAPTGGGGGKKFPAWAAAVIAVLVVLLVVLVGAYFLYTKWWVPRRAAQNSDKSFGGGAGYFSSTPKSTGKSPLVKLQSSSSTGMTSPGLDGGMGSPAPTFQNVPLTTGSSNSSDSMDGFRGFLGATGGGPPKLDRTTPAPHVATPVRPSWISGTRQEPISEETENPMAGFSATTSMPRGASMPRNDNYTPYTPSRAGGFMSYLRGGK